MEDFTEEYIFYLLVQNGFDSINYNKVTNNNTYYTISNINHKFEPRIVDFSSIIILNNMYGKNIRRVLIEKY